MWLMKTDREGIALSNTRTLEAIADSFSGRPLKVRNGGGLIDLPPKKWTGLSCF
jgi:hypothetical protein